MSWTGDLLDGLAAHIAAAGLGTWRPTGTYGPSDVAIVIGVMPPGPDRVVCLTGYSITRPDGLANTEAMVQVRTRGPAGDVRTADAVGDPIRDLLDGSRGLVLGGIQVPQIVHASGPAPIGLDSANRPERTDNYLITAERPTPLYPD